METKASAVRAEVDDGRVVRKKSKLVSIAVRSAVHLQEKQVAGGLAIRHEPKGDDYHRFPHTMYRLVRIHVRIHIHMHFQCEQENKTKQTDKQKCRGLNAGRTCLTPLHGSRVHHNIVKEFGRHLTKDTSLVQSPVATKMKKGKKLVVANIDI